MLTLTLSEKELFNEADGTFLMIPATELHLEHSLISLSKWESKWKKPYLGKGDHSREETLDYIYFMSMDKNTDYEVISHLNVEEYRKICEYIQDPYTATKIYDRRPNKKGGKAETYTSEVLYYYMIYYGIPWAAEKWHLNRLITLIRVCGIKGGTTNEAMDMNAIFAQNRALHAARKAPR